MRDDIHEREGVKKFCHQRWTDFELHRSVSMLAPEAAQHGSARAESTGQRQGSCRRVAWSGSLAKGTVGTIGRARRNWLLSEGIDYRFPRCGHWHYQLPDFAASLYTAAMKPNQNVQNGKRQPATPHLLQLLLLPLLMAVAWAGCKQDAKVAGEAGESRHTTNRSSTLESKPAPESRVLSLRATASPASCAVGEKTTITAVVFDGHGKPVPGAIVQIAAGGGRFLPSADTPYDPKARLHSPYSASGTSDQEGRFVTWWVVNPAAPAYVMDIRATKESWGEAQTNLEIVIKH